MTDQERYGMGDKVAFVLFTIIVLMLVSGIVCSCNVEYKLSVPVKIAEATITKIDTIDDGRCYVTFTDVADKTNYTDYFVPLRHSYFVGERAIILIKR